MSASSPFTQKIYAVAARIPKGKVATYGQVARLAGNTNAARAVGNAMKRNPDRRVVPCHRVVASDGSLTGYSFGKGIATKKNALLKEGVIFIGIRVDLARSQWRAA